MANMRQDEAAKPIAGPKKENSSLPWCQKCRDHTVVYDREHRGPKEAGKKYCQICGGDMQAPIMYLYLALFLGGFSVMGGWASYAVITDPEVEGINWGAIMVGIPLFGCGSFVILLLAVFFLKQYMDWLKWSKEPSESN